jgi:hypothetical protein
MYGAAGEHRPMFLESDAFLYNIDDPEYRDSVVQLYPPLSPYIKNSFEGILMYEIAGGFIHEYFNYVDPTK